MVAKVVRRASGTSPVRPGLNFETRPFSISNSASSGVKDVRVSDSATHAYVALGSRVVVKLVRIACGLCSKSKRNTKGTVSIICGVSVGAPTMSLVVVSKDSTCGVASALVLIISLTVAGAAFAWEYSAKKQKHMILLEM